MRYGTNDGILMRRHLRPSTEAIYPRHIEPMRMKTTDVGKVHPVTNLIIIVLGILIAGAVIAVALPHN